MKIGWTIAFVFVVALALIMALRLNWRDARIDPFVDRGARSSWKEAAIEREVVEAELRRYGPELIPALRTELNRGSWRRYRSVAWVASKLPRRIHDEIFRADFEQDRRREQAALTLGRLGQQASNAIPDLKALASAGNWRSGHAAEAALALIQRGDATVQSNAIAALSASSQPRRVYFAQHSDEIWPDHPEMLNGPLRDSDETVRASALHALRFYESRASNYVPVLLQMLADPSPTVRPSAALALGLVSPQYAETAVAVMLDQQRTNDSWTGDNAHLLYQAMGPAANLAVPTLRVELTDARRVIFHGDAAGALWRITGEVTSQIVEGLSTGVRIGVQRTQLRCLHILREIGPPATAAAPALHSLTNHPRILIRQLACEALESISRPLAK